MRRGYRGGRDINLGRRALFIGVPLGILLICLAWIWKADRVKAYSSIIRQLESQKKEIIAENAIFKTELLKLRSFGEIEKIAGDRFGLTQKVRDRLILADPVTPAVTVTKNLFAGELKIYNWIEDAVFRSNMVTAETGDSLKIIRKSDAGKKPDK
jgi:hypothetical protein